MNDAVCFFGLGPKERQALKLQLLCEISQCATVVANGPTVAAVAYAAAINVDFNGADYQVIDLAGDIDLQASLNRPATGYAKSVCLRLNGDGSNRNLTYNANWTVVGTTPSTVTANKTGIVSLTALGPNETDVILVYQEEP